MATVNKKGARTAAPTAVSPVRTVAQDTVTFEGAPAYSRDAKSELFLLAVTSFYGEDTFYEKANDRNDRFKGLIRQVAGEDPDWLGQFLPWLRKEGNIRTAAIVGAVEAAKALINPTPTKVSPYDLGPARRILAETITRADEPAEALAYWLTTYGQKIPAPVRRGVADAALRLYNERNFIKWDSGSKAIRMANVLDLTHPDPRDERQSALFKYILDSRRQPTPAPETLTMLRKREALSRLSDADRSALIVSDDAPTMLAEAGMTWEQVSSWGKFTAKTWEALIPTMGYMALLRNLRNFQEAGIGKATVEYVANKLADPAEVAKSRQLPFRFLSASLEATNPAWALPLEAALQWSTQNIPSLPGRTLVLVDTSSSMSTVGYSAKSKVTPVKAGALFAIALAAKGEHVDLYGYADHVFQHPVTKGMSVLREAERFIGRVGEVGHGTQTAQSLKAVFNGQDRVVIVTDCQTFGPRGYYVGPVSNQVPAIVPIYAFNMAGYAPAMMETSNTRHEMGGLSDQTWRMISLVEAGQQAKWPWLQD